MKSIALLSVLAAGSVLAGDPVVFDKSPVIPPAPSLYSWFAGATAGYLLENEEDMYTLHVGVDLPNQLGGWDQAIYLEVGYTELSDCFGNVRQSGGAAAPGTQEEDGYGYGYGSGSENLRVCLDLEIIPVTLNYKLEKQVSNSLNWYIGVGAGVAFIDADVSVTDGFMSDSDSDDDTVFYAQAFTGLLYNVNPSWELYGGVRVVYFDEPSFGTDAGELSWSDIESAFGFENTDYLVELGARLNF